MASAQSPASAEKSYPCGHSHGIKITLAQSQLTYVSSAARYIPVRSYPLFLAREVLEQLAREANGRSP